MGWKLVLIALALGACGETVDVGAAPGTTPGGGAEAPEPETEGTTPSEPGPTGIDLGCADMEISWELEVAWQSLWWSYQVAVARTGDGDGDGDVDLADPVTFVSKSGDGDGSAIYTYGYDTTVRSRAVHGAWQAFGAVGDVDGEPGAEVIASWYSSGSDAGWLTVDGTDLATPSDTAADPWLADIDGDGQVDVVLADRAIDPTTGSSVLDFGMTPDDPRIVAVDLDLDGSVEILGATARTPDITNIGIIGTDGAVHQPCSASRDGWTPVFFAVGDLDGDAEGEFVAASINQLDVCDSDGSQLHHQALDLRQPAFVAIGDLDGDLDAEIVVTGAQGDDDPGSVVMALDHRLELLWFHVYDSWTPLSLADLDADGTHEILVLTPDGLEILDGDGTELATWALPEDLQTVSWHAQPVVADVDLDGLAEIVLPLSEMVVLDTAVGGFPAPGAAIGWAGPDHFPGYMDVDGTIDVTGAHWLTPGHNAWNAQPACAVEADD